MSILRLIYDEVLWRPLFNGLVWVYDFLPWKDLGLAIVVFTVIIRIIITPLLLKARKTQKDMSVIQPEVKRIQEQFKNNREAQSKALMELYSKHKMNPFSGCLVSLVQLPILITLFQVFRKGFGEVQSKFLYPFVVNPGILPPVSFGMLDLSKGNIYLGVFAAITQYLQTKLTLDQQKNTGASIAPTAAGPAKSKDFTAMLQWQTLYVFPALILVWSYTLPSALTLYWTVLNVLGILQEIVMRGRKSKVLSPSALENS